MEFVKDFVELNPLNFCRNVGFLPSLISNCSRLDHHFWLKDAAQFEWIQLAIGNNSYFSSPGEKSWKNSETKQTREDQTNSLDKEQETASINNMFLLFFDLKINHHLFDKHMRLVCFDIMTISSLTVYNVKSQYWAYPENLTTSRVKGDSTTIKFVIKSCIWCVLHKRFLLLINYLDMLTEKSAKHP